MWEWIGAVSASWAIAAVFIVGVTPMLKEAHRRRAIISMSAAAIFFFFAPIIAYMIWHKPAPKTTEVAQTNSTPPTTVQTLPPTSQQNNQNSSGTNFQGGTFNGPMTFNTLSPPIAPAPIVPPPVVAPPKPEVKRQHVAKAAPEQVATTAPEDVTAKLRALAEYCRSRPATVVVNGNVQQFAIVGSHFDDSCGCIDFKGTNNKWTVIDTTVCRSALPDILRAQ
jgi:hypothetical protein